MDVDRIDEELDLGELEEWVNKNDSSGMGGMMNSTPHQFHVNGLRFRVIEKNGNKIPRHTLEHEDSRIMG